MSLDGEVNFGATLKTGGFEGPLAKAQKGVAGLGAGLMKLAGPAAALAGVAGGIGAIGKALGGAASLEQMAVSFDVMTGSAEKGKALLDGIRKMGAATPFEFPTLAEGGKTLLNFGIEAEHVVSTLRMLGDVAGGDAAKMDTFSRVFGKVASTGKLTGQEFQQLVTSGFNPLQEMSRTTGESIASLTERMSQGGISAGELEDAFRSATSDGGQFFGMMEKQSKTTMGLLSTLKDNINDVFVTAGQPVNDALKPILEGAIEMVQRLGAGLQATVALAQAAIAEGKLGELVAGALKVGAMEGVNYLVGGLQFAADAAGRMLQVAFRQVTRLFSGDFNEIFAGMGKGLSGVFSGLGMIVRSSLGGPFNEVVARFQAGLQYGIEKLLEGIGRIKIPGFDNKLAGFKGTSFADLLEGAMGANDPATLRKQGEAAMRDGIGAIGAALKGRAEMLGTDFAEAFAGMEGFSPAEIFDSAEAKAAWAGLAKSLDPEAFDKLQHALRGTAAPLEAAAEEAGRATSAAAAAVAEAAGQALGGDDEGGRRKIRLHGAEESERRRVDRMSAADKAKLMGGGSFLGAIGGDSAMARARIAAGAAGDTMSPQGRRGGAAGGSRSSSEGIAKQTVELLKLIEAHTQPLAKLQTA